MALILIYILPVLFVFILTPKSCESTRDRFDETAGIASIQDKDFLEENQVKRHEGRRNYQDGAPDVEDDELIDPEQSDPTEPEVLEYEDNQEIEFDVAEDESEFTDDTENGDIMQGETDPNGVMKASALAPTAAQEPVAATTTCPKCTNKFEEERQLKIEMVKQQLLKRLGLESAPKVDGPLPPLPFDFYVGEDFYVSDEEETGGDRGISQVNTREIFVFGEDITHKCVSQKSTGCYSFDTASSGIDPDLVSSIELWIYKQPDVNDHHIQEFMVSELEPFIKDGKSVLRFRNIVKRIETRLKYGWMKIYVHRSVLRWLSKPHRNHGLAVVCKTCQRQNHKTIYGNKEGYTPILVFYMKKNQTPSKRPRRQTQCIEGGSNCCHRETLEINFRDIGWDYIMTPDKIRPNFCVGSCNGIQAAYYNHTRLVQTIQQQSASHSLGAFQTCCSPVSFARPQSLLYRDHMGVVRKVDVPDLIVGECGCT